MADPLILRISVEEWDIVSRDRIEQELVPALAHPDVVIDLSAVKYLDSSALNLLVAMHRKRLEQDGCSPVRLVIASTNVRKVFRITDLDTIFQIYDTVEEALA